MDKLYLTNDCFDPDFIPVVPKKFSQNLKFYTIILCLGLVSIQASSQTCVNKYAGIKFTGTTYDTFTRSITTAGNDIISAGLLYDYNSAGHIARYTEKGTPIWSYTYKLDYYDFIKAIFFKTVNISDMIATPDGGALVAGNVEQVLSPYGLPPPVKNWGLLSKLDRFGKVEWTKTISNQGDLSITDIYETADGDLIAYMATDNGQKKTYNDHSYGRVLRMNSKGQVKWSSLLYTFLFDAGGLGVKNKRAILQAKNGNIIIGDVVHKTGNTFLETKEGNLHFLELDYTTGKVNWESSYEYPVPVADPLYSPDLLQVIELPAGGFSFTSSLYLPSGATGTKVKRPVTINTDNKGIIQTINAYVAADGSASRVMQATFDKKNGNRTLLADNDGQPSILQLSNTGQIIWQQGYQTTAGSFPANSFSAGKKGFNIFMSNNRSKQYRLLITDEEGAINCFSQPSAFSTVPAVLNLGHDSVVTKTDYNIDSYYDYAYPLKRDEDYPLDKLTECQQTLSCCTDFIDRLNIPEIHICTGSNYSLPDGTIVSDSGLYNVTSKTAAGCDSIRYYRIIIDKNVKDLRLGADTCLKAGASFVITATPGYQKYFWMKNDVASGNTYKVSQPGVYEVLVQNICGSKSDSIEIFDLCDYPLYMPNAFTPNGDGINDFFKVPALNKNKLIRLTVYNRWGQVYFQTKDAALGWNGRFKHQEAEGGVYIYYLEMTGLSGHRLSEKGTIMLIR